ncbi:plasma membrane fusion protein prm1 [Yamadazyma tenuis]|nr:plasma membrane fusion protein prm1 [Yamadazyma tenuis]
MEAPNYLDFKDRLAQVWCNRYSVILVVVLIKVYLFKQTLSEALKTLSQYSTEAVDEYNSASKKMQAVPEQYAAIVNSFVMSSINSIKSSSLYLILLFLKGLTEVLKFVVTLFLGTLICLISELVQGFADFAANVAEEVLSMINSIVKASTTIIQSAINGLSELVEDVSSGLNSVSNFFTGSNAVNATDFITKMDAAVSSLNNITIPSTVFDDINKLKTMVPDFDDLEDEALDSLTEPLTNLVDRLNVSVSFSLISSHNLNQTIGSQESATINSRVVAEFVDELESVLDHSFSVVLIVLVIASVGVMVPLAYKEYSNWKKKYKMYLAINDIGLRYRETPLEADEFRFLNIFNIYTNNVLYSLEKLGVRMNTKGIWLVSYCTSSYSIFLVGLAVAGLFTILLEYVLFRQFSSHLGRFPSETILNQASTSMSTNIELFVNNTNYFIQLQEAELNDELFGSFKNTSALIMASIDTFVQGLNSSLIEPFQDTPLSGPMSSVVYCFITRKLETIREGFEWVQNNLYISVPSLPDDISSDLTKLVNSSKPSVSADFNRYSSQTIALFQSTLFVELMFMVGVLAVWVVQLVAGIGLLVLRKRNVRIGDPKPLTAKQKLSYGLPFNELR